MRYRTEAFFERLDQRQNQLGIEDALGVCQGALAYAGRMKSLAYRWDVENIFDGSQAFHGWVEKRQQVSDDDLIEKQISVGMVVMLAELLQLVLDDANEASPDDLLFGGDDRRDVFGSTGPHVPQ